MASFITLGEEPCTVPKILEIMRRLDCEARIMSRWQKVADHVGLSENIPKSGVHSLEDLVFYMIIIWKQKFDDKATLGSICTILYSNDEEDDDSDTLQLEFRKIMKQHIIGDTNGILFLKNFMRISDIFALPLGLTKHPKKNDPLVLLSHFQAANKLVHWNRMGKIIEHLVQSLDVNQLKALEEFSFVMLDLETLAQIIDIDVHRIPEEALQIIQKMNLNNYGKSYLLWFVVANAVLKVRMDEQQKMEELYKQVFEFKVEGRKKEGNITMKFKNEELVYFIDLLVGMWKEDGFELYKLRLRFEESWLNTYIFVLLKANALNLLNDVLSYPHILHKIVQNTTHLDPNQLEVRKDLVLSKINEDPWSVNFRDEDNLPPVMMRCIHVDLIQLLINGTSAYFHTLDQQGRNFVHLAADYLPGYQFRKLVRCIIQQKLTALLNVKDYEQRTPLTISLQKFDTKPDIRTVQLFAKGGADFDAVDMYGLTPLYYAISRKKNLGILEALVECGADWRWKKWNNATLLHIAAREDNLEAINYLLKLGCNVNAMDFDYNTPLDSAVGIRVKFDVIKLLVAHGAVLNSFDMGGYRASV